jgi:CheR methyltransferase, all-alpha domain
MFSILEVMKSENPDRIPVDLFLMEMMMPEMDGIQATRKLHEEEPFTDEKRIKHELELAKNVQSSVLSTPISCNRLKVDASYHPSSELAGYDFRNYSYPSIRRRIWHRIHAEQLGTVSVLQDRVLHNRNCLDRLFFPTTIRLRKIRCCSIPFLKGT